MKKGNRGLSQTGSDYYAKLFAGVLINEEGEVSMSEIREISVLVEMY
jgi:hypothetical protein